MRGFLGKFRVRTLKRRSWQTRPLPAYILAGGQSSRFGSDKARAILDGQPLICRVAEALQPVVESVTVVADLAGKYDDLGLNSISDRLSDVGPMGGLQAALADAPVGHDWILLASCDLAVVRLPWIRSLLASRHPGAKIVAFKPGRWQPLLALYHRDLEEQVDLRIAQKELTMWRFLDAVQTIAPPTPADWPALIQINTPEELRRFEFLASRR